MLRGGSEAKSTKANFPDAYVTSVLQGRAQDARNLSLPARRRDLREID